MSKRATVTSKGRITIPKEVRRRLGLEQGDHIEFTIEDGRMVLHRTPATHEPFTTYAGALNHFAHEREAIEWMRKLRDDD